MSARPPEPLASDPEQPNHLISRVRASDTQESLSFVSLVSFVLNFFSNILIW